MSVQHFSADWFTQYAGVWLAILGHLREQPVEALEIGSYEGRSACWMVENLLAHPGSRLTCVDTWDGQDPILKDRTRTAERMFELNTQGYGKRIRKWVSHSLGALASLNIQYARFDLVFIDGNHEARVALQDLVLAWPLVKSGGYLVFDDYGWQSDKLHAQPAQAWDLFFALQEDFEEITPGEPCRQKFVRKKAEHGRGESAKPVCGAR